MVGMAVIFTATRPGFDPCAGSSSLQFGCQPLLDGRVGGGSVNATGARRGQRLVSQRRTSSRQPPEVCLGPPESCTSQTVARPRASSIVKSVAKAPPWP